MHKVISEEVPLRIPPAPLCNATNFDYRKAENLAKKTLANLSPALSLFSYYKQLVDKTYPCQNFPLYSICKINQPYLLSILYLTNCYGE